MGIRGLTSYVQRNSRVCMKSYKLHDTKIVMDGDCVAHTLYSSNQFSPVNSFFNGDYDRFGHVVRSLFELLSKANVTPIICVRGTYGEAYSDKVFDLMKERIQSAEKVDPSHDPKFFPLFIGEIFRDIAREYNADIIRFDYKDIEESAKLAMYLNCPLLSLDSDFYIFDVLYIPLETMQSTIYESASSKNSYKYVACETFQREEFLKSVDLSKDKLPIFAAMLTNDLPVDCFLQFRQEHRGRKCFINIVSNFLRKETKDTALKKIMSFCNSSRPEALEGINKTIETFTIDKYSKYIKYLELVDDNSLIDKLKNLQLDAESLPIDYTVEKLNLSLDKDSVKVFLDKSRKGFYPSCFLQMILTGNYATRAQIEDIAQESSHMVSTEIISAVYKILTQVTSRELSLFVRSGRKVEKHMVPAYKIDLPNIVQIQSLDMESRQKISLDILSVDKDFAENVLDQFSSSWKLYIIAIGYLAKKCDLTCQFIQSLILCKIVLSHVDKKVGHFIRSTETLVEKFGNESCHLTNKTATKSSNNMKEAIANISQKGSISALKNILHLFKIKAIMKFNPKLFDRRLVHSFSQFQSCFIHIKHLNSLLNMPYENCDISESFNGTLIYNLTTELKNRSEECYVSVLLKDSDTVLNCFNLIMDCLKEHLIVK